MSRRLVNRDSFGKQGSNFGRVKGGGKKKTRVTQCIQIGKCQPRVAYGGAQHHSNGGLQNKRHASK